MSSCVVCAKPLGAADVWLSSQIVLPRSKMTMEQLLVEVGIRAQGPGHVCMWCEEALLEVDGAWMSRMLSVEAAASRSPAGSNVHTDQQGLNSNGVPTGGENSVTERGGGQMDTSGHGPDLGSAPGKKSSYSEEHHSYGKSAPSGQKNPVQNGGAAGSSSDSYDSDSSSVASGSSSSSVASGSSSSSVASGSSSSSGSGGSNSLSGSGGSNSSSGSSGSKSSSGSSGSSSSSNSAVPAVITAAILSKPCCMCDHVFSADDQPVKGGTPLAWKSRSFFEYAQEKGLLPPAPRSKNFCSDCHDVVTEVDYWSFMFDKAVAKLKGRNDTFKQVKAGILVHDVNGEVVLMREWMRKSLQQQEQAGTDSSATAKEQKSLNGEDLPAPPAKNDKASGEKKAKTPSASARQSDGRNRSSGKSVANPGAGAPRRGEKRRLGTNNRASFNDEQVSAENVHSFHRNAMLYGTPSDESDEFDQQMRGRQGKNVKKARLNPDPGMND